MQLFLAIFVIDVINIFLCIISIKKYIKLYVFGGNIAFVYVYVYTYIHVYICIKAILY